MAASRVPGPADATRPPEAPGDDSGLIGAGFPPGPVGEEIPLDAPSAPKAAPSGTPQASQASQGELNLVGSFPRPSTWNDAKELKQIQAGKWFPSTPDFLAVAGSGSIEVKSVWDFLLKIVKAKSTITRLNFFSHGTTGLVAFEGEVLDDGSNVLLAKTGTDGKWTQIISSKPGAIVDPYAKNGPDDLWGTFGEDSSKKVTVGGTSLSLDDVRAKFGSGAVIWLYLCHGAADPNLFQEIANTFQVTVKGFKDEIEYHAPKDFPKSRKHTLTIKTASGSSPATPVADFHSLDSETANIRTAQPKKPTP
jgi:hypothetical protein